MYSPNSHRDRDLDNDSTSAAVKIILDHQRRERRGLFICLAALLTVLVSKIYREFIMHRSRKEKHKPAV
jgi:hypothetical protein